MTPRLVRFTSTAQDHVRREKVWWLENRTHTEISLLSSNKLSRSCASAWRAWHVYPQARIVGLRRIYLQKVACPARLFEHQSRHQPGHRLRTRRLCPRNATTAAGTTRRQRTPTRLAGILTCAFTKICCGATTVSATTDRPADNTPHNLQPNFAAMWAPCTTRQTGV